MRRLLCKLGAHRWFLANTAPLGYVEWRCLCGAKHTVRDGHFGDPRQVTTKR